MEQPLVSIVTITRNRGKLIGRCIKSVLRQTYNNLEHIVIDGASDDETDEVVTSYKDNRLVYVKLETNWPVAKTINYGIELAKGKYVTFLDSDDEYLPTKIEKQVRLLESLPEEYGMVYCWMTEIDSITSKNIRTYSHNLRGYVGDIVASNNELSGTPTFMFRANTIKQLGGWKDKEEIGIVSDWELAARCCQKWAVDYVPESLINIYVNHESVRMTDDHHYYDDLCDRYILFHKHFLSEFSDVFNRKPYLAKYHYFELCRTCFKSHRYKDGFSYYYKMLKCNPSVKQLFKPLIGIFLNK